MAELPGVDRPMTEEELDNASLQNGLRSDGHSRMIGIAFDQVRKERDEARVARDTLGKHLAAVEHVLVSGHTTSHAPLAQRYLSILKAERGQEGLPGWKWSDGDPGDPLWFKRDDAITSQISNCQWDWSLDPRHGEIWGEAGTALEAMEAAERALKELKNG